MKRLIIKLLGAMAILLSSQSYAQPLPIESSEYKQLKTMGYDIFESNDKLWSIATLDDHKVAIQKQSDRIVLARYFTRKKGLNQQQEFELYRIINQMSIDYLYQIALRDDYIAFVVYLYGPHDPKTLAKLMRYMEYADFVIDKYPDIYKLLN